MNIGRMSIGEGKRRTEESGSSMARPIFRSGEIQADDDDDDEMSNVLGDNFRALISAVSTGFLHDARLPSHENVSDVGFLINRCRMY